jgi:hypothetical protein
MLCLVTACTLAGTVGLMFSTFLNPFFAASATALVLGIPALAGKVLPETWLYSIPVYALMNTVLKASFGSAGGSFGFAFGVALVEIVAFWFIAARIFSRIDIAVSVE